MSFTRVRLREAGPPELDSPDFGKYQRKAEELLARAGRLEDAQVRQTLTMLADVRRRTVEELLRIPADAKDGWRAAQLTQLRAAIDDAATDFQRRYGAQLTGAVDQAWGAGAVYTEQSLAAGGVQLSLAQTLSRAQLEVTATLRADLVRRVGADMREQLARAVTLGIAGEKTPVRIMAQIAGILKTEPARNAPGLGPIATQAERIVRTEMGRAFNTADRIRHDEIAEDVPGIMHYWAIAKDRAVQRHRPTHLAAGRRYAPGGSTGPIPYGKAFTVGGETMRYPHDPRGSARNVIACRCVDQLWYPSWYAKGDD